MEVTLLPVNEKEVIDKLYLACRTCYNAGTPNSMYRFLLEEQYVGIDRKDAKLKLLKHVINSGHHSTLEHQQLTFLISGVSRALTHQLTRHRICNISQQSQRYVEFKDGIFEYVTPSKIRNNEEALKVFEDTMGTLSEAYKKLVDLGMPAEDARAVLPNACTTNLTWSCNLRELMHICNERLCTCAQQEIRQLFMEIKKKTVAQLPFMNPYLVPKCEMLGYCNEDSKRSCGRKYTKDVVIGSLEVYS